MAKKVAKPKDETPHFEEAMEELDSIVQKLERGGEPLEQSLDSYSKAIQLLKNCHQRLEEAERKVEVLSGLDAQGNPIVTPMDDNDSTSLEEKQSARSKRRSASSAKSTNDASGGDSASDDDTAEGLF